MAIQQRITPFLWFNDNAEEAMEFYTSLFEKSRIIDVTRHEDTPGPASTVVLGTFELDGQRFMALNGGPQYQHTEAFSLYVPCETQEEVDRLWHALTADGGEPSQCGWLKDRFGLSWQIIPTALPRLMGDPDPEKAGRVMEAMLQMSKIDVARLQAAYDGE